jgi:hypothetical protein
MRRSCRSYFKAIKLSAAANFHRSSANSEQPGIESDQRSLQALAGRLGRAKKGHNMQIFPPQTASYRGVPNYPPRWVGINISIW